MQIEQFNSFVGRLRNAYGLQQYTVKKRSEQYGEVVRFLHEQIGEKIPGAAADWMFEKILDSSDRFPDKFHRVLRAWLWRYYEAYPDRQPPDWSFRGLCKNPYCRDGWFRVFERQADILTVRLAPCGECCALGRQMTHGLTRAAAAARGYLLPTEDLEAEYSEQWEEMRAVAFERSAVEYAPRRMSCEG
jgi:hypothetical protein